MSKCPTCDSLNPTAAGRCSCGTALELFDRSARVRFIVSCGIVLLVTGCTPTVSRLAPYRDDPAQALDLAGRANQFCCRRRGATDLPPHRFTTDGCSLWPDGAWVNCCVVHDIAYWCGGSRADRQQADAALQTCVADTGSPGTGTTMFLGVRIGGSPWPPFPFRWGYGWDWPRGYENLPIHPDCPPTDGVDGSRAAHVPP